MQQATDMHLAGRNAEAVDALGNALRALEAQGAPDPVRLSKTLYRQAALHNMLGRLREARLYVKRCLDLQTRHPELADPGLPAILNMEASIHLARGELDAASRLTEKALRIEEQTLGADHPDVGVSYLQLAVIAHWRGRLDEAVRHSEHALRVMEARKIDKTGSAAVLTHLGILHDQMGKHEQALAILERARKLHAEAAVPNLPTLVRCEVTLASLYARNGRKVEAAAMLDEGLRRAMGVFGADSLAYGQLLAVAAETWRKLGNKPAARTAEQQSRVITGGDPLRHRIDWNALAATARR